MRGLRGVPLRPRLFKAFTQSYDCGSVNVFCGLSDGTIVLRVIYVLFRLRGLIDKQGIAVFLCIAALLRILGIIRE